MLSGGGGGGRLELKSTFGKILSQNDAFSSSAFYVIVHCYVKKNVLNIS